VSLHARVLANRRVPADRGAGPVEYLAIVLFIALVVAALVLSGIGTSVSAYIDAAVCRVGSAGGLDTCARSPGTVDPPAQPVVQRPENTCNATLDNDYGELAVTFPVRFVDIRGGIRLGYQQRRIVTPGSPDRWEVTVYGFGEGAVATPSLPGGQTDTDDPLGPTQPRGVSVGGGAWLGLNVTGGETYSFDSAKEAEDFPWRYAKKRAQDLANVALETNPVTALPTKLIKVIPWLGDKVKDVLEGDPLPPRKEWSVEAGPTGGFSGKLDLFRKVALSVGGRGWHLMGVRRNDKGETTFTMKDAVEVEPSVVIDIGEFLPRKVRGGINGRIDKVIDKIEQDLSKKYGVVFRLPAKARAALIANWPDIGLTWKGKMSIGYQLTTDRQGNLTRYGKTVDMQGNWYGRGTDEVATKKKDKRAVLNVQVPLGGGREVQQSSLDLTDPRNLDAARDFFSSAAQTWAALPVGAQVALSPEAQRLDRLTETAGTRTRQTYESNVGNTKFTGEAKSSKGSGLVELKLEQEKNVLSEAEIWEEGRGWVPWTACHR
jgi:Flp pilus assembly pilin Flp